jgi:DegV family protein with EDD domain
MTIRILTDSTCDVPPELAQSLGISVLPAYVNIGDDSFLDGIELSREEFYQQLPTYSASPTTAAPAIGSFTAAYEELAAAGATHVISIHLAASLSGVLNSARLGAEAASIPVTVYDSQQLSMGLGLLAVEASRAAANGADVAAIITMLDRAVPRSHVFAMLDTMEYLRRSGRVSWAQFGVGTLLRIKPILHVYQGEVSSLERVRTSTRALQHMLGHVAALGPLQEIALLHTNDPAGATTLRKAAQHLFPEGRSPIAASVTPTIGAHVGPGALGIACITQAPSLPSTNQR